MKNLIELAFSLWEKEVVSTEELIVLIAGALEPPAFDEALEHICLMEDERETFVV